MSVGPPSIEDETVSLRGSTQENAVKFDIDEEFEADGFLHLRSQATDAPLLIVDQKSPKKSSL